MAPRKRIIKEDILAGAVRVIQHAGPSALSVRNIAGELGCSTQPLYSEFRNVEQLQEGDRILISEGCTHHRQCDDIGTVKLPRWIREHTGKQLNFEFTSGTEFPAELERFRMIIHCGGCMLNEREMKYRIRCAEDAQIPITNYGTAIAYMQGILERSIQIFQR